jgi:hypothetical protein
MDLMRADFVDATGCMDAYFVQGLQKIIRASTSRNFKKKINTL